MMIHNNVIVWCTSGSKKNKDRNKCCMNKCMFWLRQILDILEAKEEMQNYPSHEISPTTALIIIFYSKL